MVSFSKKIKPFLCLVLGISSLSVTALQAAGLTGKQKLAWGSLYAVGSSVFLAGGFVALDKWSTFGLPDASSFYRRHFGDALRRYGVKNPEKVPLKNDSGLKGDKGITGLFAVRINEKSCSKDSEAQRIVTCYHEAAHYALRHQWWVYLQASLPPICGASCIGLCLDAPRGWFKLATGLGGLFSFIKFGKDGLNEVKTPWLEKPHEKEADSLAIEGLIKAGKQAIVQEVWHEYKTSADDWNGFFNLSFAEQLKIMQSNNHASLADCRKHQAESRIQFERWDTLVKQVEEKLKRERAAIAS